MTELFCHRGTAQGATGRVSPRRFFLTLALLFLGACSSQPTPPTTVVAAIPGDHPPLLGQPEIRQEGEWEIHSYELELEEGQFVQFAVDQRGIDVELRLYSPEGEKLMTSDGPYGKWKEDFLSAIAQEDGIYRFEVGYRPKAAALTGAFKARIVERKSAGEIERRVVEAEALFYPVLHEIGRLLSRGPSQQREELIVRLDEVSDRLGAAGMKRARGECLYWAGTFLGKLGRWDEAATRFEKALAESKVAGPNFRTVELLNTLGKRAYEKGRLRGAKALLGEALQILDSEPNPEQEAKVQTNLGSVYNALGQTQFALDHHQKAYSLSEEMELRGEIKRIDAAIFNNLAGAHASAGNFEPALTYYQRALKANRQESEGDGSQDDQERIATTLNNIGWIFERKGDLAEAERVYLQAEALVRVLVDSEPENEILLAKVLSSLGRTLTQSGRAQQAVSLLQEAISIRRELGNPRGEAISLQDLGYAQIELRELDKADENLERALELSRDAGDKATVARSLFLMASLEQLRGAFEAASNHVGEAIEILESRANDLVRRDLRSKLAASKWDFYELQISLMMSLHKRLPEQGFAARAFEIADSIRARSLIELLVSARVDLTAGVDKALLALEREIRFQINELEAQRQQLDPASGEAPRIDEEVGDLLEAHRQVEADIRQQSPGYAALQWPESLSVEQVRSRLLSSNELLLEWSLGEEGSFLFVVGKDVFEALILPPVAEIEELAKRYQGLLLQRGSGLAGAERLRARQEAARIAGELSSLLLAPARNLLGEKTLILVPDGILHYLPMDALPDPLDASAPLKKRHSTAYEASAASLATIRSRSADRTPPAKQLAIVADPIFDKTDPRIDRSRPLEGRGTQDETSSRSTRFGYSRLPFSAREAEAISAMVPKGEKFIALGGDSSKDLFQGDSLQGFRVLHLAVHGEADDRNPERSRLVLSLFDEEGNPRDSFLHLHDIYNLKLDAELVVLSACETALGQEVRGEGLIGLTRGFLYAGARSVIASLWRVDDESTSELMTHFYRGLLQEELPPAEALRQAQLSLQASERWSDPYFWAGFVLRGDWR